MKKKIGIGLLIIIIGIQFIRTNDPITECDAKEDFLNQTNAPEDIAKIITTSCYDCHSNYPNTPWYGEIAPVSWYVNDHINEGRDELNFSAWGTFKLKRKKHKLEECWEQIEKENMPLEEYLNLHGEAKLTDEQRIQLIMWFKSINLDPAPKKKELSLNNGAKWEANEETTTSINKMIVIAAAEIEDGRISHYAAMGQQLNLELETMFKQCTMKGEEHEMLHLYLVPLMDLINELEAAEDEDTAMIAQKNILKALNNYSSFFE